MFTPDILRGLKSLPGLTPGDSLRRYLPYVCVLICIVAILVFGRKFWDANDDIHMAMIAQGYGLAAQASPGIVYSNVIWGWLAMHLGTPFRIPGYTWLAYATLLASAAGVAWAMLRKAVPGLLAMTLLLAMFARALLEPQFSITAGYAAAAGLALAFCIESRRDWPMAIAACLLLLLGSWVRFQECLFVCVVAAPFLLWHLYRQYGMPGFRPLLATLIAAAALAGSCKLLDYAYYSGPQWQQFREMNAMRRPFTDYGLHSYFADKPDLLGQAGMTDNDMDLIGDWFYLDDKVFNPQSLGTLLQDLSPGARLEFNLERSPTLARPFETPLVYLLALVGVLAVLISRHKRVAIAAVLCLLACILVTLLLGRPGVPRVFPGPMAAIALLALLDHGPGKRWLASLAGLGLLAGVCYDGYGLYQAHVWQAHVGGLVQRKVCALHLQDLQVVWGAPVGFSDRYLYSPTSSEDDRCALRLYHVGVLQLLPGNLQRLHAATGGKDLIPALLAGQPLYFITNEGRLEKLRQYLQEHYGTKLDFTPTLQLGFLDQYRVQVETGHKTP